ncbi:bactofilin family protein [Aestuariivirga litoralis]|uniref:bactofilin family protein n=1 Tax=Aestuariivirga litoralis TaxID=2650924 RepID=UPI0018C7A5E0|nr:polymer-forming cytoskeletal protein [Aestuariivirga litoralis]MBG1231904.1 polymer-forming cytoskeletal protein [Aestuariivirga litoralis]
MIFNRKKASAESDISKAGKPLGRSSDEPSYLASDVVIEGNIVTEGEIHIDGELRGSVRAHTCLVDARGQVNGPVTAQFVLVRGRVYGAITASRVTIQKGAHVEGDVIHDGLSVEHGAFVMGNISQNGSLVAPGTATLNISNFSLLPPRPDKKS